MCRVSRLDWRWLTAYLAHLPFFALTACNWRGVRLLWTVGQLWRVTQFTFSITRSGPVKRTTWPWAEQGSQSEQREAAHWQLLLCVFLVAVRSVHTEERCLKSLVLKVKVTAILCRGRYITQPYFWKLQIMNLTHVRLHPKNESDVDDATPETNVRSADCQWCNREERPRSQIIFWWSYARFMLLQPLVWSRRSHPGECSRAKLLHQVVPA